MAPASSTQGSALCDGGPGFAAGISVPVQSILVLAFTVVAMGRDGLIHTVEHDVDSGYTTIQHAPLHSALVHVQAARAPYARLEAA